MPGPPHGFLHSSIKPFVLSFPIITVLRKKRRGIGPELSANLALPLLTFQTTLPDVHTHFCTRFLPCNSEWLTSSSHNVPSHTCSQVFTCVREDSDVRAARLLIGSGGWMWALTLTVVQNDQEWQPAPVAPFASATKKVGTGQVSVSTGQLRK